MDETEEQLDRWAKKRNAESRKGEQDDWQIDEKDNRII